MITKWHLVDQLLAETCSTAQELLDWLSDPYVMMYRFPCNCGHKYLGKWSLYALEDWECDDANKITVDEGSYQIYFPDIGDCADIYSFWNSWRLTDPDYRDRMTKLFKERYSL